jgi:hypothetical protein
VHNATALAFIRKLHASFRGGEGQPIPIRIAAAEDSFKEYNCKLCCNELSPLSLSQLVIVKIVDDFLRQTISDFRSVVLACTDEQQRLALEWSTHSLEHFQKVIGRIPIERLIPRFLLCELQNCMTQAIEQNKKYLAQRITMMESDPPGFFSDFNDAFVRLVLAHSVFSGRYLYVNCLYPLDEAISAFEYGEKYESLWVLRAATHTRKYPA